MSSLRTKPKTPPSPYVAPQVSAPTSVTSVSEESKKTEAEISADTRTASLLRRSRGRFGTISTSFRGFLNSADSTAAEKHKTLLGE